MKISIKNSKRMESIWIELQLSILVLKKWGLNKKLEKKFENCWGIRNN